MKIYKKIECRSCNGTGLYIGMGERDGAAIVCYDCKGTGKEIFELKYNEFTGRKKCKDVKRVYEANMGIGIGNSIKNKCKLQDFGGMSYKDWIKGKKFPKGSEMRKYVCPAWWFQSVNYKKKPKWCYTDYDFIGGAFRDCKQFGNKDECWKRIDKENENKQKRTKENR